MTLTAAKNIDLSKLTAEQQTAVTHGDGPLMVNAGAGSGKTTVLINRIAYMIQERGIDPKNIFVATFTKAAAKEMRERLAALTDEETVKRMGHIGTWHSFGYKVVASYFGKKFDGRPKGSMSLDSMRIIRGIMASPWAGNPLGADLSRIYNRDEKDAKKYYAQISFLKNSLVTPAEYRKQSDCDPFVADLYEKYEEAKKMGYLTESSSLPGKRTFDFDDLLIISYQIMQHNESVRNSYRSQFTYLLVDEGQDNNVAQYALLDMIAGTDNITIVGDDRQSIYSWRAGHLQGFIDFAGRCTVCDLSVNFRSNSGVVALSERVIKNNVNQLPKNMTAGNSKPMPEALVRALSKVREARKETVEAGA